MAGSRKPRQRVDPSFDSGNSKTTSKMRANYSDKVGASKRGGKKSGPGRRKSSSKTKRFWLLRKAAYWMFVLAIWCGIGVSCLVGYYAVKMPQTSSWAVPKRPPNARIASVSGSLIANRGLTGGQDMRIDEMSPYIPMAVIAIEDRRFKSHFGVDPIGFTRAMYTNIKARRLVQGGSTLTQQLAKNLFLEPKRNIERKVQEAILAFWLEHKFSKDEILELYLNRVYFGSGAYGVDAASRRYFNKSARDVTLSEAAILAGLLKAPSTLSPARNPKLAEARAQIVLGAMRRSGFVTDREAATALTMQAKKAKRYWSGSEHYVADMVMQQLPNLIGKLESDVIIDTTIDMDLQRAAGKTIADTISKQGKKLRVSQGAMVSLDGTGAIRALVGGVEYADSQFNRASEAKRQPGSAFKPMVYLTALEAGLNPGSVRLDRRTTIGKWTPENYDKKYRGPVTLDEALSKSLNTISAQLASEFGPRNVTDTANRLGINSKLTANASIALGTSEVSLLELTSSYAPFANGGYLALPYIIRRITTEDGKVLYDRNVAGNPRVVGSNEVGMMNQMLRRTVNEGTGKRAQVKGWQIGGKTGTSQNSRDALFVGYSANLITGFWYGNDDGTPTKKVTGGSIPASSFSTFMTIAHNGVPNAELPGYYLPTVISVIPTPRPNRVGEAVRPQIAVSGQARQQPNQIAQNKRKPLSNVDGPIPANDVGGQTRKKPKNILELLLGG